MTGGKTTKTKCPTEISEKRNLHLKSSLARRLLDQMLLDSSYDYRRIISYLGIYLRVTVGLIAAKIPMLVSSEANMLSASSETLSGCV